MSTNLRFKMKIIIFVAVIAFAAGDTKYYKLEKAPIREFRNDPVVLKNLADCLLDVAPCSELFSTYRAVCAESVEQKCRKCTPYQKHAFGLFLHELSIKFPKDYASFIQKYDPENKNFQDLLSELSKYSNAY